MSSSQKGLPHSMSASPPHTSLTNTSRRPCSPSTRSKRARTSASTRWSTRTAMPWPPAFVTRSAVSSMVSGRAISLAAPRVLRPVQ